MKKTATLLAALLILPIIASCTAKNNNGDEEKGIKVSSDYVITRSSNASQSTINSAKSLKDAYEAVGVDLKLSEDWYKDESEIPVKEILVGDTNRKESKALKESFDADTSWKIAVRDEKIVIVASSDMALSDAVSKFTSQYIEKGEGIDFMSTFAISGSKSDSDAIIEFVWEDGDESLIRSASWGPRVYTLSDGTMIAGIETSSGIKTLISTDGAKTWKREAQASFRPSLACANVNFFQDGENLYLAYRAIGERPDGYYTSLQVSVSTNGGQSWSEHSTVAEYTEPGGGFRGVWEPYLGMLNGKLTCFYANDSSSVTPMQNIEYVTWNGSEWGTRTVVSNGVEHNSRDGMPVWMQLSSGEYVCVIESSKYRDSGKPFVIQLLWSRNGKSWSEPVDIYTATANGSKAGAPGIVELSTGQLVISFQTDEDATVKGDSTSVMKTIISDGTNVQKLSASNFTKSDNVFGTPDGEGSVWTGIWYYDGWLYAAAGTSKGSSLKKINVG